MSVHALDRVVLSFPSLIQLAKDGLKSLRSWIQVARTGSFKSNRYGPFSISQTDLSEMVHNFKNVTPKEPTELPVDYDHLSMDPKMPGDGIAAGWMKKLELRDNGNELWAEVEWTPDGAERIRNQEYRFVSPSFVKNHTHKDGTNIGTTLLAAAVTNHPFLEGMSALTLYSMSAMGDLATIDKEPVLNLMEVGQRVMLAPGIPRTQDEIGATFEIAEVIGDGDDAFVSVRDSQGRVHKWFRATELLPASTTPANPANPPLQPGQMPVTAKPRANDEGATGADDKKQQNPKEATMNATSSNDRLLALAQQHATTHHLSLARAVIAVSAQYRELANTYLEESRTAVEQAPAVAPAQPLSLRHDADAGEQLMSLANTIATEKHISLSAAVKEASRQRPDLGAIWERG